MPRYCTINSCASSWSLSLTGALSCNSFYRIYIASIVFPASSSSMYFCSKSRYSIIRVYSLSINSLFCRITSFWPIWSKSSPQYVALPLTNVATIYGTSSKLPASTSSRNWVTRGSSIRTLEACSSSVATFEYPWCTRYCWMSLSISVLFV